MTELKRYMKQNKIRQRVLAAYLECTIQYVNKIINGHIRVTIEMTLAIEMFTHFKVTRLHLRPDLFQPQGEWLC